MDINIRYMRTAPSVLAPVFRSDGQARLLAVLLLPGGQEFTITELAERALLAYPTAHREVARLLDAAVLTERQVGRARLIRPNDDSPLVAPLREILLVTAGPVMLLAEELASIRGIERAFVYGSFAARLKGVAGAPPADIDLMVIGTPDPVAVYDAVSRVEPLVGRPVNPTILTPDEWAEESGFHAQVRASPTVPVVGNGA